MWCVSTFCRPLLHMTFHFDMSLLHVTLHFSISLLTPLSAFARLDTWRAHTCDASQYSVGFFCISLSILVCLFCTLLFILVGLFWHLFLPLLHWIHDALWGVSLSYGCVSLSRVSLSPLLHSIHDALTSVTCLSLLWAVQGNYGGWLQLVGSIKS